MEELRSSRIGSPVDSKTGERNYAKVQQYSKPTYIEEADPFQEYELSPFSKRSEKPNGGKAHERVEDITEPPMSLPSRSATPLSLITQSAVHSEILYEKTTLENEVIEEEEIGWVR
jgi:hypothetical protein